MSPDVASDDPPRGPRRVATVAALLLALAALAAGFFALGAWQLQRLAWKQALIERVQARLAAAPVPAPGPAAWPALSREADEYRRVSVHGRFAHERETLVQASTELGSGWWVLTPLRTDAGWWLLVNRGFVPAEARGRGQRAATEIAGDVTVAGLLRLSEPGGSLLQHNDPAAERWYSRDVDAIAAARALDAGAQAAPVAPYFIDAAAAQGPGVPTDGWPRAGLTVLRFTNNHLGYALTWFGMALGTLGAAALLLRHERRLRRAAAPHGRPG